MARLAMLLAALTLAALPAAAAEAAPKKCKKGHVLQTVKKNGKKAKKCVKKKPKQPAKDQASEVPGGTVPAGEGGATTDGGTTGAPADGYTPPVDAVAEFTRLMTGSRWYRVYANTTSTGSSQGNDTIHFCSDGQSSQRHEEYIGYTGNSYVDDSAGTWKVEKAAFAKIADPQTGQPVYRAEALVSYTSNKPDDPSGQAVVNILGTSPDLSSATRVYSGETEYQRTGGGAGC